MNYKKEFFTGATAGGDLELENLPDIRAEFVERIVEHHMDVIEQICWAALSVGITPAVTHWRDHRDQPYGLISTVQYGNVLFRVEMGKVSERT